MEGVFMYSIILFVDVKFPKSLPGPLQFAMEKRGLYPSFYYWQPIIRNLIRLAHFGRPYPSWPTLPFFKSEPVPARPTRMQHRRHCTVARMRHA